MAVRRINIGMFINSCISLQVGEIRIGSINCSAREIMAVRHSSNVAIPLRPLVMPAEMGLEMDRVQELNRLPR